VLIGIALLSWHPGGVRRFSGWSLGWPFLGAVVRALAQVGAKAALLLWPTRSREPVGYASRRHGDERGPAAALAKVRATPRSFVWFGITGAQRRRGLLMYAALTKAPVAIVAPIVAGIRW